MSDLTSLPSTPALPKGFGITQGPWRMAPDVLGDFTVLPHGAGLATAAVVDREKRRIGFRFKLYETETRTTAAAPAMFEAFNHPEQFRPNPAS